MKIYQKLFAKIWVSLIIISIMIRINARLEDIRLRKFIIFHCLLIWLVIFRWEIDIILKFITI